MVMVGDRGMITSARIEALRELGGLGWVTALRAPAIAALAADDGPLQMSLFDQANLAEISPPRLPRGTPGRLPQPGPGRRAGPQTPRAAGRPPRRSWPRSPPPLTAGRLAGADKIGIRVGKVIGRYKMAKHYTLDHHRRRLHLHPQPGQHRRRGRPGRHLRHPHQRARQQTGRRPGGRHLQVPGPRRTRLPLPQVASTWTCARSTTAPKPGSAPTCSSACSPPT